jgi:hypothetical protein
MSNLLIDNSYVNNYLCNGYQRWANSGIESSMRDNRLEELHFVTIQKGSDARFKNHTPADDHNVRRYWL